MAYNNEKLENVCRTLKAKGVYGGTVDELKRYLDAKPENFDNFLKTLKDKNIYGGTAEELSRYIGYTAPTATTTTTTATPAPTAVGGVQQPQEEKGFWNWAYGVFKNSTPGVTGEGNAHAEIIKEWHEDDAIKATRENYTADPYRDDAAYIAQNDEDIRNGKYTLKEEKTDEDIRENQLALYNATPEGKAEYDKMNTACSQKQNEYFERFSKTVEYDKLMKEYQSAYNAAVGDSAKEEVEKRYNALLNDKLVAYGGEEYEKALEDIYSKYYEKARTARQNSWEGAETRLWQPITDSLANETLKKVNEELTKPRVVKYKDKDGNSAEYEYPSFQDYFGHRNVDDIRKYAEREKALRLRGDGDTSSWGEDFFVLKTAQSSLEETQKLIDAAKKYDERNMFENLGQGVWDKLSSGETWGVGFAAVIGDNTTKKLVEKADRGEKLTENEELLMDALAIELYTHAFYDYKIGHAYKAGQVTGESIPFMIEMALSPFSGVGRAVAKKVAMWGLRRGFAKGAVTTLKVGARFGGEMLGAAGKTVFMDADAVARGVTQRMTGDINTQFEYNKELGTYKAKYNGRENMQGAGEALWNSGVSQFNENFSEVVFTPFKGLGIGRKIFKKIPVGGKFLSEDAKKSFGKFYDGIQRAKERFKIGSYGEEGGEEEVNNAFNVLFTTDTKAEDVFNEEAQIDTWLGLLPMQVAFGLLGGGAKVGHKAYGKYQKWHANRKADNNWKEWLDKQPEADRNFYNMLQERLDAGDIEVEGDVKNYIRKVLADPKTKHSEKEEKLQALAAQLYDKQSDDFQKVIHDYYGKNFDDGRGEYRNAQDPSKIIYCSVKDYQANTYRRNVDGSFYFIDLGENGNTDERGVPMHNIIDDGHNGEIIEMPADAIVQEGAIDYDEAREKYINHTQAVAVAHNRFEEGDKIVSEELPGMRNTIKRFDSDGVVLESEDMNGAKSETKISYEELVDYYQTAEDKQMEDASDKIDEQSNTSNGHVTNVKIGGSEGTFYVKSGNLVVSTDKDGNPVIDKEKSDGTFVVVNSETGEAKQIGIDQIEAVLGDAHKSEMKAQADENIRQAAYNAKHYPEGSIIYNTNTPEIGLTTVVSTDANGITYISRNEQTGEVEQSVITNDQRGQWAVLNFEEGDVLQTQMHTYEIVSHDASNKLYTVRIDGAEETEGVSSQELADILTSEQFDTAAFVKSKQAAEEQADTNNEQTEDTTQEGQQEITNEQGENGAPQIGEGGSETTPETTTEEQDEFSEYSDADIAATLEDIKKQLQKQQEIALKPISLIDDKAKAKRAKAQEEIKRLQELYDKFNAVYAQRMQAAEAKRAEEKAAAEKAAQEAAAAKKEAEEAARLEAEKKAGGVPDVSRDSAAAARKRGYRMVNGNVVKRQENTQGVYGKEVEIMFSTQDKPKGRVKVIDASQLQPSHKGGQRNHSYFITEAQPKERTDKASQVAAQKIAENINPQQITEGATAYTGAPVTNTRGEVIQGNNRSIALLMMYDSYPDQAAKYKQYLIDNAERFGLNAEEVAAMQNPVLVTELDVTDEEAIRLGQKNAQDTESGGKQTIDAAKTAQMLGDGLASFARRLTTTDDEEMTLSEMIAANGGEAIKFLRQKDIINDTQYQTAFNDKGELTDEAKNSLLDILRNLLFANAKVDNIREMFARLPLTAQKAILQTVARDANSPADAKVVPYLQEAIEVFYDLQSDPTFMAAKTYEERMAAIWAWSKQLQMDFVSGSFLPAEKFSNFAFALAATFKSQTMATQRAAFNELYNKLQGEGGDLFNATETLTLEQAVEQIYHIKLNNQQNNVTNDGSPVLGNSSKTGGSGQLGENGGTGGAKPLEGGTQSTNNRGGVGGNNQKGEGTTEKPLTPPTHKNEKKGVGKIQVEGEPFPDDISERSTMERTISKREERKQDGFAPNLAQSIKVGFKGNDIFIQIDTEDEDYRSSSQFVVRNAAQNSIEEIADELGRNEMTDLDEEEREALKSILYERAVVKHLQAIDKGNAAYSKASANHNAETPDAEVKAAVELSEAPEREFAQWLNTLPARDIQKHIAPLFVKSNALGGMRAQRMVEKAFSSAAEREIVDYVKESIAEGNTLVEIKASLDSYVAENIYGQERISQATSELAAKIAEKAYNEQKGITSENATNEKQKAGTKKKAAPLTNNEQKKVDDFAKKMTGKGVNLIDKAEDLPKSEGTAYRAIKDGYKVMGWFNIKTGQVYIYTPNARNYNEVMKTLLHEFVSHKGLRDMLGAKKFDELCRNVWKMMPYEQRLQYAVYVTKNIAIGSRKMQAYIKNLSLYESAALLGNEQVQLAAADEYMAHFAEKGITEQNRSLWETIADAIRDLLRKIGFDVPLRDSDIARLLYESKNRLTQDMSLEEMTNTITTLNGTNSIGEQVGNRTQNATRFSIYENQDIAKLNDQFNADIERYIRNETPRGFRFELGHPSAYLISAGFPNLPITLRSALLARKAGDNKHPFEASEIRDLVKAIQKPIAIFNYSKDNMRNLIVDTVHNGKHFLIGVTLGYKSGELEVNSVSGMFPKESHEWIKWIQDGKAIRIDQKEKVQDLINSLRTNPAESERIGLNLDLAAKIVQNFENPKLPEENDTRFSISGTQEKNYPPINPRLWISPVRGGWTKEKILRRLKESGGSLSGYSTAAKIIAEFNSPEELSSHMFYHGTTNGSGRLLPSITMSDRDVERYGRGGYGDKYWGISVTSDKRVASTFSGTQHHVRILPIILLKGAKVIEIPQLHDAYDLNDHIVELWEQGVDAVWIGDKNGGEKELCVLNPRAIVNIDWADSYQVYNLGGVENPLHIIDQAGIEKLYEDAKHFQELKKTKPSKPDRYEFDEKGKFVRKDETIYQKELDEYYASQELKDWQKADEEARQNIRFSVTPSQSLTQLNDQFNNELQQQIDGTLPAGHIYQLGLPDNILRSTGIPNLPIQMSATRLNEKATSFGHDYELSEVRDLVKALQKPLAIFAYGDKKKAQNIIVSLQKDGNNFVVGLSLNPTINGRSLEINSIRNVFPKDNAEWLNWITQDKALYLDKEKIQNLIDQQRTILADVDYLDLDSAAKIVQNFENPKLPEENDSRFSISGTQVVPLDEHTLVGLHNISADKLRKALKAGGLANPSAAVIDIAKQNHHGYGEISLVMPSALVDSKTGRNVGTYAGDAYTPMYPSAEFRQGKDTEKRIKELVKGLPESIQWQIAKGVGEYMNGIAYESGLQYLFLKERGQEPPMEHATRQHPDISIKEIDKRLGVDGIMAGDSGTAYTAYSKLPVEQLLDFNLWLTCYGDQAKIEHKKSKIDKFRQEGQENAARLLEERYKEPLSFADFDSIHYNIFKDERDNGDEKPAQTINNAIQTIYKQGLSNEFREWQQQVIDNLGYEEVLFAGYTASGNRRYIPNTVENASRLMNQKADTNWNNGEGVSETKALLMDKFKTLSDIRDHKDILENDSEKIKQAYGQTSDDWFQLGIDFRDYTLNDKKALGLSDNPFMASDEALARLQEAMLKRNPIAHLNAEYNYSLSEDSEFGKRLMEMKERIKNLPSKYFETKFNRPVYLNEFRNAVIPNNLPQDLRDGLSQAGLGIYEYDPANETTSRREATLQATEDTGIRFSISDDESLEFHKVIDQMFDKENGENLSENNNTRFSISSYTPETDNTLTETARQEMQTIRDEAIANGAYMKAPNGKPTHLNERQWLQVRTQAFKEWFGDWELAAKANAIQALQAIKATPHSMSRKELESVYKNLPSVTKGNTTISFYGNTFGKNYRENGLFAKAVPVLDKVLDNAVLAYRETDNRAGELRKDGTVHKPHRNIESYDNYIGKVELDGKEYYVRFTVANEKGESGVHSQFVSNVELYNNSTKNASGLDLTLQSRLVLDGITDAKLQQFFESAKSAEQNCSKIVDENGEPKVVYHGARADKEFHTFGNSNNFFIDNKRVAEMFANEYAYQLIVDGEAYTLSKSEAEEIASSIEPYYPNDILQLFDDGVDNILDLTSIDNLNDLHEYGGIQCGIDTFDGAESISIKPAPNKLFEVFLNVRNPQITDFGGKTWEVGDDARLTPQSPHDGMIAKNIIEGGYAAEIDGQEPPAATDYVVQSPNQIKSATDNNGSFDNANNDTRFSISDGARKPLTHNERVLRDGIVERLRASGLKVLTDEVGQRVLDLENKKARLNARHRSAESEQAQKEKYAVDNSISAFSNRPIEDVRKERKEQEKKILQERKELYKKVLSGDFNDVTLQLLNSYLDNVTPRNRWWRPLSKRIPQKVERGMRKGERTSAIDVLFSRICESAVPKNERFSPEGKRRIEEKKKELLKKWAVATGNWHTSISDFTNNTTPIGHGGDSFVYQTNDGKFVIKASAGKENLKKFPQDLDAVALFNYIFPNCRYEILGYGEIDGKFVKFLKQPFVDFANSTPLSVDERVAYMEKLGFYPINRAKTAFSNGTIIAADIQGNNIVKDNSGNIRVIDADMKLHTKEVGGQYSYSDVETDTEMPQDIANNGTGVREHRVYYGTGADKVRLFRTANGEAYGFTVGGKIYIDTRIADSETLVHEYTHLWATALQQCNPKEWSNIVELMKGTPAWEEVKRTYPELESDNEIADEVLAHYSGRRGAERLRDEIERIKNGDGSVIDGVQAIGALERVRKALNKFWKGVADFLHIHFTSAEDVADQVMSDLLNGVNPNAFDVDEKGTRFQIIGEQGAANLDKAEEATTRLDNLQVARDMEQAGKDAKAIRLATGWERGADNKWRYEIPDIEYVPTGDAGLQPLIDAQSWGKELHSLSDRIFNEEKLSDAENKRFHELCEKAKEKRELYYSLDKKCLTDYVRNKELFNAYPRLKTIEVRFVDRENTYAGGYNNETNTITLNTNSLEDTKSTLAHEIQHAIQHIEGFAKGGNIGTVRKKLEQIVSENAEDAEYATQAKEDFLHLAELAGLLKNVYPKLINSGIENYEQLAVDMYWDAMDELGNNIDSEFPYDDLARDGKTPYEIAKSGSKVSEAIDELNRLADERKPSKTMMSAKRLVDKLNDTLKNYTDAQLYEALGGEVESRNVQKRLGMTEKQRRNTLLQETEDVAREDQIFLQEYAGASNMQLDEAEKIEKLNAKFNEQLQRQIDGTQESGFIYQLGNPSSILLSAGLPNLPIEMSANRLVDKSNQENHPFDLSEIMNLPNAIHNPLAVFRSATHADSNVILTELTHSGKNFVVAIQTNKRQGKILVNSIRSIHPRTTSNVINWINEGLLDYANNKLLEWVNNKIETREYLNSSTPADVRKSLVSAAKVVQNFENPKLSEENFDESADDTRFSIYGGNRGYVGYSKSVRAVEAEEEGKRSISNFDKEFVDNVNAILQSVGADPINITRAKQLTKEVAPDEWHHTSMYGNKTNYYSPETIARAAMSESQEEAFDQAEMERWQAEQEEQRKKDEEYWHQEHERRAKVRAAERAFEQVIAPQRPEITKWTNPITGVITYWLNLDGVHVRVKEDLSEITRKYDEGVDKKVAKKQADQYLAELRAEANAIAEEQINDEEASEDIRFSIETDEEFESEFGMEEAKSEPIPFENVVGTMKPDEGLREYALRMNAVMNGYSEERMQQIAELVNKRMERGGKWYAKLYRHLYDKYYPLDRFQKALAEQGALLDQRTDAYSDIFRSMGRATTQFQKFYDERFKPLTTLLRSLIESKAVKDFKDVRWADKKTMSERDKITLYLRAKDMVECEEKGLVERGAAGFADFVRHADNALQGWTPQEYVAAFEAAIGEENVSRLWERVNAVNKFSLDYMQEHGFVDEKLVERYKEREFYVPQRGFEEGESHVDLNALRKAEGRKSLSADPLPFMAGIAEQTIMSVEKNRTKQKMLQFAIANMRLGKETGTFDVAKVQYRKTGHILENGLPEYEAVYDGIPQEELQRDAHYRREIIRIREFLKDKNLTDEQYYDYLDKIEELEDKIQYASSVRYDQIRPEIPEKINQNRVDVWQNGKHYSLLFADRAVADALNRKDGEMGRFVRFLNTAIPFVQRLTQYFSRILTQQNPAFALWNLLRDTGLGFHTNLLEHPSWVGAYSKNLARVQKAVAQYAFAGKYADSNIGKYLQEYFNEGAQTGFSFVNGIEDLQRQISRELKRGNKLDAFVNSKFNPLQLFSNITEWSELTVRVAQYVTAREHGYTPEQAATEAKEVSTNFDRRGNLRLCYNFYSFFNAAMQGTNKHIRQVMNGHGKGLAISLALLMGAGLLNTLLTPDDPDDEMGYTEFDRMQNICLGRIRIPLAPGLRAFWALGVQAALAMQGRKTWNAALVDGASFLFSEIMPINVMGGFDVSESTNRLEFESKLAFREFIPTGLQPLYDLANNTTFNGSTVYREPYLRSQDGKIPQTMLGKRNVNGLIKLSTDKLFELGGGDLSEKTLTKSDGTQVSGFFDVNPSKVEYLIKSATGGIGQFAVDLFNTGFNAFTDNINSFDDFAATMPVIKRAWKPYKEEKEAVRDFYILKGRIEAAKKAEGTMPRERKKILREAERAIAPLDRKGRSPEKATKEQLMKMHNIIIKWNENYW